MLCKKCGNTLTGKQERFCSPRCSKNYLKALYRRNHREEVNAYNRNWKKAHKKGYKNALLATAKCFFCGSSNQLEWLYSKYELKVSIPVCSSCKTKIG